MSFRRNWLIYLALILYLMISMLILNMGINEIVGQGENSYFIQTILYVGFFGICILINVLFFLITRIWIIRKILPHKKVGYWIEGVTVIILLAIGLVIRIYYIIHYPVAMESDYKIYYDIAIMIKNGTLLTESNNEFIALFPNVFGYSYILSKWMTLFGESKQVCLYLNAILSVLTSLLCYGIGKKTTGSIAGVLVLILSLFWPSQIIYSNFNGTEALFNFLLFSAAYLLIFIMIKYDGKNSNTTTLVVLHFCLGILLAIASSIRPLSFIFLIAVVLCLLLTNYKLIYKKSITEVDSGVIFMSRGWMRAIIIVTGYFLCSQIINTGISNAIEKDISNNGSLGYTLMVGLDISHDGCFSTESTDFYYNTYYETGSADDANQACLMRAIETVKKNPIGVLKLLTKKFYLLWAIDDYSVTLNVNTMSQQGILTEKMRSFFDMIDSINSIYYITVVLFAAIGVCFLFFKDNNAQLFAVFFVGATVIHLITEVQNRYHYYLLQNFSVLAAVGVGLMYQLYLEKSKDRLVLLAEAATIERDTMSINDISNQEDDMNEQSLMLNTIDVIKAIQEGHIIITASKVDEDKSEPPMEFELTESISEDVMAKDELTTEYNSIQTSPESMSVLNENEIELTEEKIHNSSSINDVCYWQVQTQLSKEQLMNMKKQLELELQSMKEQELSKIGNSESVNVKPLPSKEKLIQMKIELEEEIKKQNQKDFIKLHFT